MGICKFWGKKACIVGFSMMTERISLFFHPCAFITNMWISLCSHKYISALQYHLVMKRNPLFYELIIVKPAIMLSVMNNFMFLMPYSVEDRIHFGTWTLLFYCERNLALRLINDLFPFPGAALFSSSFFLLMIVADVTPAATKETPLIGTYIFANLILIIVTMAISATIIWMKSYLEKSHTKVRNQPIMGQREVACGSNRWFVRLVLDSWKMRAALIHSRKVFWIFVRKFVCEWKKYSAPNWFCRLTTMAKLRQHWGHPVSIIFPKCWTEFALQFSLWFKLHWFPFSFPNETRATNTIAVVNESFLILLFRRV